MKYLYTFLKKVNKKLNSCTMKSLLLLFLFISVFTSCKKKETQPPLTPQGELFEYKIAPSLVNTSVSTFNNDNYIYLDTRVTSKNKLLVFFPGTNSSPIFYTTILKKAASLGYHVIGLMYANGAEIYTYSTTSTDNTRYRLCRLEAFNGIDVTPGVNIDNNNAVKTRLIKLLQFLQTQYPTQSWQQFLANNDVVWNKCVLSGHSQGGGLSLFIAKQVAVDRAISFSSLDWNFALSSNADWITMASATPVSKFYSFNHQSDELFNFSLVQTQLQAMGLTGPQVNIDVAAPPYGNSRTLNSLATPAINTFSPYHSITCLNGYVPKAANGDITPEYQKAWEYLLDK